MCLSPIHIVNPSRYISVTYQDKLFIDVPCGHCSECLNKQKNEWLYRSYFEGLKTLKENGFIYLECLTYRNSDVPHISDFFKVSKSDDYMCFNRDHIRSFFNLLRQNLRRSGLPYKDIRYFLATEYGTGKRFTHRPHIHIVFYLSDEYDPLLFSRAVADSWKYGRTDGYGYKPYKYIMGHNYISSLDGNNFLRVADYVSKYVNKDSEYTTKLYPRIMSIVRQKYDDVDSVQAKKYKLEVSRVVNQFHLNSQYYGYSALDSLDIERLFNTGTVLFPTNSIKLVKEIPLPKYFERKLFYNLAYLNGVPTWIINEDGVNYKRSLQDVRLKRLESDLRTAMLNVSIQDRFECDFSALADYIVNYRGRVIGDSSKVVSLKDRLESDIVYNYSTSSDFIQFGKKFVTDKDCHNQVIGYKFPRSNVYDIDDVPVYYDSDLEYQLSVLMDKSGLLLLDLKKRKYLDHLHHFKQYFLGR